MKVAYLGPNGTYAEAAAEKFVTELKLPAPELIPVDGIPHLLSELSLGKYDVGVAPLRNTLAGDYDETVYGIRHHGLEKIGETLLVIELAVGIHANSTIGQITEVWSKDTALRECSQFLTERFPAARRLAVSSTGFAMKEISDKQLLHVAAVGSEMGLRRYGLTKIANRIENPGENLTDFILLKRRE